MPASITTEIRDVGGAAVRALTFSVCVAVLVRLLPSRTVSVMVYERATVGSRPPTVDVVLSSMKVRPGALQLYVRSEPTERSAVNSTSSPSNASVGPSITATGARPPSCTLIPEK
ncbi:hypothetical protein D3C86_1749840 [compost metagenome]